MNTTVPALGLGLVVFGELLDLAKSEHVDVVEFEPQTLWEKVGGSNGWTYRPNNAITDALATMGKPVLLHGIGHPFGGTVRDPIEHLDLLRITAERVDACWVSEHLSFNRVLDGEAVRETGFLLPPRQSAAGARVAAARIDEFRRALGRPTAFELGVNYLRPDHDALDDGSYFASIAEQADSGVLLDLHNLWCNERNGRSTVRDVIDRIPLDRVWEIHLAGGMELDGFTLDAHSGRVPDEVVALAADIIPRLTHLGAIIYEVLPEHLPSLGVDGVVAELDRLRPLWSLAPRAQERSALRDHSRELASLPQPAIVVGDEDLEEAAAWELSVDRAVRGCVPPESQYAALADDPGTALLRQLVAEFRASSLTRALRYTMIAMLSGLGTQRTHAFIDDYCNSVPPDGYRAVECHHFAEYLIAHPEVLDDVPYLADVVTFERALIEATLFGTTTTIVWSADPAAILESLDKGLLPQELPVADFTMVVG